MCDVRSHGGGKYINPTGSDAHRWGSAAGALGLAYGGKWVYDTVTKAHEFFK
jgi:hypothetical protein